MNDQHGHRNREKKRGAYVSQTRALLAIARRVGGPNEAQRKRIREKIEAEIAGVISGEGEKDDADPTIFAALDAIARWSTLKRSSLTAFLFCAAFAIDATAPRELSILGVYLVPIGIVAWCFPEPSAWLTEEVNAPAYSSTSLLILPSHRESRRRRRSIRAVPRAMH